MKTHLTQKIIQLAARQSKAGLLLFILLLSGIVSYAQPRVVFLQNGPSRIYSAPLNFSTVDTLIKTGLSNPDGACFSYGTGKMFWVEGGGKRPLKSANFDGSNVQIIDTFNTPSKNISPRGIAIDEYAGKLYIIGTGGYATCNLDGSNMTVILNKIMGRQIAVNPALGKVYYTTQNQYVFGMNADGTGTRDTIYQGGIQTWGIRADLITNKLYFSDLSGIFRCNFDGSQRDTLFSLPNGHGNYIAFDIDVVNNKIAFANSSGSPGRLGVFMGTLSPFSISDTLKNINYIFDLTFGSASTLQASNINFYAVTANSFTCEWTKGNGTARVAFLKADTGTWAMPVNGTTYTANPNFGSGSQIGNSGWFCVYNGTGQLVNVTGLAQGTKYRLMVCEFGGTGADIGYNRAPAMQNPRNMTTILAGPSLSTVTTAQATSITSTTASLGGIVSSNGGANVTERGIVYGSTANPTISNGTKVAMGAGNGSFSQVVTNLSPSTSYHFRAFSTNSVGTSYGADSTFTTASLPPSSAPTVSTAQALFINLTNATLGGIVSDSGSSAVTERGIVYATTANPTTANTKVSMGSGIGSFSLPVSGFTHSTTYHVRAYAINSVGTSYGADSTFVTASPSLTVPLVRTSSPFGIGYYNAALGGGIIDTGSSAITERGVVLSTSPNPTVSDRKVVFMNSSIVVLNVTGLTPSTLYHVRYYAYNNSGVGYGGDSTFRTLDLPTNLPPLVRTNSPSLITATSAFLAGNVLDTGSANVTDRGIVYGTASNPTLATATKVAIGSGRGGFNKSITGLNPATTYHYKAYAISSIDTSYGGDSSFTTLEIVGPILTVTSSFTPFTTCSGTTSEEQSFKVSGINLVGGITVTAPSGFEVSATSGSGFTASLILNPTSGSVSETTLYIRISATATGTLGANLDISSPDATLRSVSVSGTSNPTPAQPAISIQPASPICKGAQYLNFGAATAPASGVSYQWSASNANLYAQGSTKQYSLISFPNAGAAVVTLTATQNGCSSSASVNLQVNAASVHTATVRYFNKNFVCEANQVTKYQWGFDELPTLNGNIIQNEINQNYFNASPETATKAYWVISTSGNCYQKTYHAVPLSAGEVLANELGLEVFPNPFSAQLQIRSSKNLKQASVMVYDLNGRKLSSEFMNGSELLLNLDALSAGVYLLHVEDESGLVSTNKIIKH
ncbi:hypothetical protein MASR2M44_09620 [Bacteroidota bacterium]